MSPSKRAERPSQGTTARGVAATVLLRVSEDSAFAARVLDAELSAARLAERDARLAAEIVYGTLRALPVIDGRLDPCLRRGRPEPFTLAALRTATYQALYLSRVPSFAIVQETVGLVKAKRGVPLSRLTNAVLRKLVAERPAPESLPSWVLPPWMVESLRTGLGEARLEAFLDASSGTPALCLHPRAAADREALMADIRAARADAQLTSSALEPCAVMVRRAGDPRRLPGFDAGRFYVQDLGAHLVGRLAGAQPGQRVLDVCAGHGGKTLQLLAAVGADGAVTAADVHERKLEQLTEAARRLAPARLSQLTCATVDFSVGTGGLSADFDVVLVDAPCTGLGTLRRRPELPLRLQSEDPARLAQLQISILRKALSLVRPGGQLVYAVCSASHEEGEGVAAQLEAQFAQIRRSRNSVPGVPVSADDDGVFRVGPWLGEPGELSDVYQIVRWEVLDTPDERV